MITGTAAKKMAREGGVDPVNAVRRAVQHTSRQSRNIKGEGTIHDGLWDKTDSLTSGGEQQQYRAYLPLRVRGMKPAPFFRMVKAGGPSFKRLGN
jgi:hypothetical protein